jgi:hypothetical protein
LRAWDTSGREYVYETNPVYVTSWKSESVENAEFINDLSLALDSEGYQHISYFMSSPSKGESTTLKYAKQTPLGWELETVYSRDGFGGGVNCSLALDPSGNTWISYTDLGKVIVARREGGTWLNELTVEGFSTSNSLAVDSSVIPRIACKSALDNSLKYAWRTGLQWQIETVDSEDYDPLE